MRLDIRGLYYRGEHLEIHYVGVWKPSDNGENIEIEMEQRKGRGCRYGITICVRDMDTP